LLQGLGFAAIQQTTNDDRVFFLTRVTFHDSDMQNEFRMLLGNHVQFANGLWAAREVRENDAEELAFNRTWDRRRGFPRGCLV
jgi:hypothetical protein